MYDYESVGRKYMSISIFLILLLFVMIWWFYGEIIGSMSTNNDNDTDHIRDHFYIDYRGIIIIIILTTIKTLFLLLLISHHIWSPDLFWNLFNSNSQQVKLTFAKRLFPIKSDMLCNNKMKWVVIPLHYNVYSYHYDK